MSVEGLVALVAWMATEKLIPVSQSELESVGDERHHPLNVRVSVGHSKIQISFGEFPESDPNHVVARVLKDGKKITHAIMHRRINKHGVDEVKLWGLGYAIKIGQLEEGTPYEVQVGSPAGKGTSFVCAEVTTRTK